MSDFVFNGPATDCTTSIVPPPAATIDPVVANDGWFPDIDVAALRRAMRIRESVTPDRLRDAVLGAMITVDNDVTAWRFTQITTGHADLAAVPAPRFGGESRLAILYRRAVGCFAKADVVERYRDIDTTAAGDRKVEDLEPSIDELRRDGRHAIRDLIGTTRTTVELI